MSDFSDDWLALRAPADSAARADGLLDRLALHLQRPDGRLSVLDLGCGTGANLRHAAPQLARAGLRRQRWTCVDHDPVLLARLPARMAAWAQGNGLHRRQDAGMLALQHSDWEALVEPRRCDLAGDPDALLLPAGGLVTASALLDLVSAAWLEALLARCRSAGCALLFVLSYDGRCTLSPAHADDAEVIDLVNRHQRTDKGFGPALGPAAAETAAQCCHALGYRVDTTPSDWDIGPQAPALQRALLQGWRDAAAAMAGAAATTARLDAWLAARLALVASGRSRLRVGHRDLLALP
jgi:SAM-dependent methyltransferase